MSYSHKVYTFSEPVTKIQGVGSRICKKLASLGILTVGDLLYHFPHRYEDFSTFKKISDLTAGETATIQGQIEDINLKRTWKKRMTITECQLSDDTGTIKAVWFNNPMPIKFLRKGRYVQLSGKIASNKQSEIIVQHPNFEIIGKSNIGEIQTQSTNSGGLISVYPETQGINSYWFRRIIKNVLAETKLEECLPEDVLKAEKLPGLDTALKNIHFPENLQTADISRKRFAFEKMFLIQIKALQIKKEWETNRATKIKFDEKNIKSFVESLSFKLTDAQKKTTWTIIKDLEKNKPMNRLLEGDVGSGKTVVAAIAALSTVNQKKQVAILVPTEVLATQHFESLAKLFKGKKINLALLTSSRNETVNCQKSIVNGEKSASSKKIREKLLKDIKKGEVDVIVGTHAIIQKKIVFGNLALVIVDEQHRFGVGQRAHLQQQAQDLKDGSIKSVPHLLTMTATPIPRTLSLAIFGNLDISIIDEFPEGRKKIITKIIPETGRDQAYAFIKKQVREGRQIFVICPLVEESSKMTELRAATEEFERLQKKVFPDLKLGLIHGRKKPKEKEELMQKFKNKKFDILVSTSVVEVGIDIPNATIMMIEGAERFGLSQLHQFRGRVGRGAHQSYCFLLTSDNAPPSTARLRIMGKTNDGFLIAQEDLKLRGPGQFMGTVQSGIPDIAMGSLSDVKTIKSARDQAQRVIAFDPKLKKFPLLKKQLQNLETTVHME